MYRKKIFFPLPKHMMMQCSLNGTESWICIKQFLHSSNEIDTKQKHICKKTFLYVHLFFIKQKKNKSETKEKYREFSFSKHKNARTLHMLYEYRFLTSSTRDYQRLHQISHEICNQLFPIISERVQLCPALISSLLRAHRTQKSRSIGYTNQ